MFVLKTKTTYRWPVSFVMPKGSGEVEQCEFTAEFARLPQSLIDGFLADGTLQQKIARERTLADSVLVGWSDVHDLAGDPIPFSDETKAQMLDITGVRAAVVRAFFDSVNGHLTKN